jgi:carbon storage regulator
MLVLRRKVGEELRIGENVVIKVLSVNGRAVRLGIEAPQSMPIWRQEWLGRDDTGKVLPRERAVTVS